MPRAQQRASRPMRGRALCFSRQKNSRTLTARSISLGYLRGRSQREESVFLFRTKTRILRPVSRPTEHQRPRTQRCAPTSPCTNEKLVQLVWARSCLHLSRDRYRLCPTENLRDRYLPNVGLRSAWGLILTMFKKHVCSFWCCAAASRYAQGVVGFSSASLLAPVVSAATLAAASLAAAHAAERVGDTRSARRYRGSFSGYSGVEAVVCGVLVFGLLGTRAASFCLFRRKVSLSRRARASSLSEYRWTVSFRGHARDAPCSTKKKRQAVVCARSLRRARAASPLLGAEMNLGFWRFREKLAASRVISLFESLRRNLAHTGAFARKVGSLPATLAYASSTQRKQLAHCTPATFIPRKPVSPDALQEGSPHSHRLSVSRCDGLRVESAAVETARPFFATTKIAKRERRRLTSRATRSVGGSAATRAARARWPTSSLTTSRPSSWPRYVSFDDSFRRVFRELLTVSETRPSFEALARRYASQCGFSNALSRRAIFRRTSVDETSCDALSRTLSV